MFCSQADFTMCMKNTSIILGRSSNEFLLVGNEFYSCFPSSHKLVQQITTVGIKGFVVNVNDSSDTVYVAIR